MAVHREAFAVETKGEVETIDITDRVAAVIRASRLRDGIACVFLPGSTAAVIANEYEPGLMTKDLPATLERLVPTNGGYAHSARWSDDNGHSHLRSAVLGPSFTFPFADGKPLLGTWQQIVLVELDVRPRRREVLVQLVGE